MFSIQTPGAPRAPAETSQQDSTNTSTLRHASTQTTDDQQVSGPLCGLFRYIMPRRRQSKTSVQSDATHQPTAAELTASVDTASTSTPQHPAPRSARSSREYARQEEKKAALANLEAKREARERIEETSHALLAVVMEGRNPFVEGAPYYNIQGEGQAGTPLRMYDVLSLRRLYWESRKPRFYEGMLHVYGEEPQPPCCDILGYGGDYLNRQNEWRSEMSAHLGTGEFSNVDGRFTSHHKCIDRINTANLVKAVQTWRTRELIRHALPQYREQVAEIPLYFPEQADDQNEKFLTGATDANQLRIDSCEISAINTQQHFDTTATSI